MQLDPALLLLDGTWVPGPTDVLEVRDPRTAPAKGVRFDSLNVQMQPSY